MKSRNEEWALLRILRGESDNGGGRTNGNRRALSRVGGIGELDEDIGADGRDNTAEEGDGEGCLTGTPTGGSGKGSYVEGDVLISGRGLFFVLVLGISLALYDGLRRVVFLERKDSLSPNEGDLGNFPSTYIAPFAPSTSIIDTLSLSSTPQRARSSSSSVSSSSWYRWIVNISEADIAAELLDQLVVAVLGTPDFSPLAFEVTVADRCIDAAPLL